VNSSDDATISTRYSPIATQPAFVPPKRVLATTATRNAATGAETPHRACIRGKATHCGEDGEERDDIEYCNLIGRDR